MAMKPINSKAISHIIRDLEGPFTYARFNFQIFPTNPQNIRAENIAEFLERCRVAKIIPFATGSTVFTGDSFDYKENLTALTPRSLPSDYDRTRALQERIQGFRPYQFSFLFHKPSFPKAFDNFKTNYGTLGDLIGAGYLLKDGAIFMDPNKTGSIDVSKLVEIAFEEIPEPKIEITAPEALKEYETNLLAKIK
ncbi:hypothetical protein HZA98_05125 [Candidatus Woesearchaeota archaeon]|nr:hypothetical protein [Candidatus Woesearchaeota archaeon]